MKLGIGTAQFGSKYGISAENTQVSSAEVCKILESAKQANIKTIDTAAAYGSSEEVLGSVGVNDFEMVSKLGAVPKGMLDLRSWFYDQLYSTLERLNVESLYGYLFHRPEDLLTQHGQILYDAISDCKDQGLIKNIGVSIYDPIELDQLLKRYNFNIVQAPMNVFDQRLQHSGWLVKLKMANVQVHVRSIFLQGLLLMDAARRPAFFGEWDKLFKDYDNWLSFSNFSALEACIGFVKQFEAVDKIIVGIDSLSHLQSITKIMLSGKKIRAPYSLSSVDDKLIHPFAWRL